MRYNYNLKDPVKAAKILKQIENSIYLRGSLDTHVIRLSQMEPLHIVCSCGLDYEIKTITKWMRAAIVKWLQEHIDAAKEYRKNLNEPPPIFVLPFLTLGLTIDKNLQVIKSW